MASSWLLCLVNVPSWPLSTPGLMGPKWDAPVFLFFWDYNNAIGPVTISPRLGWRHDVSGTTPGPGGSFVDGRKQLTLGLAFNYLNEWIFDFAWTTYMGAGSYNTLTDRDFFAASVRYSF